MGLITSSEHDYYNGSDFGGYQFITLDELINNFMMTYVGQGKILPDMKRYQVAFHFKSVMRRFSFDVFKNFLTMELEIGPSLTAALPQDFVALAGLYWTDDSGVFRRIMPTDKTGNPRAILQDADFNLLTDGTNLLEGSNSDTWDKFKSQEGVTDDSEVDELSNVGTGRYGMNPESANSNGVYFIDTVSGLIHFSSDMSERTVTIKYLSDGLASDTSAVINKMAEKLMYLEVLHEIISISTLVPEYIIQRIRKERRAEFYNTKIRLSKSSLDLKQIMRVQGKRIKN